ncbi:MAG: hypothetical protein K2J47_04350 [Ruminococcus sp.]|nr:hypothetical protein [Ruminococcus sp.]
MKIFRKSLLISTAFFLSTALFSCSEDTHIESSSPEDVKISPQSITFEWQNVYMDKLAEFKNSADFSADIKTGSRFDLFDITGDKTPELIISPNNNGQTPCRIYSCNNGELVELGETGNRGTFLYLPDMQLIKDEYRGNGFIIGKYISYQNGAFNTVLSYSDNSMSASSGAAISYEINGEEVFLPDYDSALEPYNTQATINAGRKYTFGENALNYAVKCSESWGAVLSPKQKELFRAKLTEFLNPLDAVYAFELCDLNSDEIPELIISNGNSPENYCEIYYFAEDELAHIDGTFGAEGQFTFDTEQFVLSSGSTRWSINNSNFSANEYKHSESLAEIGRKYLLNDSNITLALN